MRVIEPNNIKPQRKLKKRSHLGRSLIAGAVVLVIIVGLVCLRTEKSNAPSADNKQAQLVLPDEDKPTKIKNFTADEFRNLYNTFAYPNTETINEKTLISGNAEVDALIRKLAEKRGYKLRSAPVSNAFVSISKTIQLQRRAAEDWSRLSTAAKKDNINLSVSEGFRSAEDQRSIFLGRLGSISAESVAKGLASDRIDEVLRKTAPPGYSRHHSGYTVDLTCDNQPSLKFEDSICFKWLSRDNYINIKQYGWIPSYPEGTSLQGPEPESWEYVWVGVDSLYE